MPERLDRCVEEMKRKGYSESQAWAICTSIIKPKSLENCPEVDKNISKDRENEDRVI